MNYNLADQIVTVTSSGVPYRINIGTMNFSMPNKRHSMKSDNSKGKAIFSERPDWKEFVVTLQIPQSDTSNDYLRAVMPLTVSFTWKDASGTKLIHAGKCKINFIETSAEVDPTNTSWEIIGQVDAFNVGSNGDLDLSSVIPDVPDVPRI